MTSATRPASLPALTGLRFIAAMAVVIYHFGPVQVTTTGLLGLLQYVGTWVSTYGLLGVNCFFILSGFVLAYRYIAVDGTMRAGRRDFWLARVARIYPVYVLSILLGCGPLLWYHDAPTQHVLHLALLPSLGLLQAWVPAFATTWNPPGWSLSVEAFFYLCFPLLAIPIGRARRNALIALLVGNCGFMLLISGSFLLLTPPQVHVWGSYWEQIVAYEPILRMPEFIMGVVLGRLAVLHPPQQSSLPVRLVLGFSGIGLVVAMIIAPRIPFVLLYDGLLDAVFVALIWGLASGIGMLCRLLSKPATVLLGEASYSMYLLHWPLWMWLLHFRAAPAGTLMLPYFAAYVALLISLSLLSLRFVETPARRAIRVALARAQSGHQSGAALVRETA